MKAIPLTQLEQRRAEIDAELVQLADYSLNGSVGAIGYQSKARNRGQKASIHIDLGEVFSIDQVVLVPTLWRDTETGPRADGFPLTFRILSGTGNTTNVLASFTEEDHLLPRIAPLAVSFQPVNASWVGLEVDQASPSGSFTRGVVKLAEVLIFSGLENVALRQPVSATTSSRVHTRHEQFIVDGFLPYLMDAAQGAKSQAIELRINPQVQQPSLTIDLGASYLVSQVNLHAIDQSRTIPASYLNDYGIPCHLRITGANQPDFSDQTVLFETEQKSVGDIGSIIMRRFPETACRYIRIIAVQPKSVFASPGQRPTIGFDEIEVLSKGRNMALDRPVSASGGIKNTRLALERMTDGLNFFGEVLPLRDWINQLARRHDLEAERPLIEAELNRRYAHQKITLRRMFWLAGLLIAFTLIIIFIEQLIRQRAISRTRERIAANLHDELGANLHAIGLLNDLAKKAVDSRETLIKLVDKSRALAEQTAAATRYCTNMLEAKHLYENLPEEMERTAHLLLDDFNYNITFQGETFLQALSARKRIDLFLFYKECLMNINRHSSATRVNLQLVADNKTITLSIRDNGQGVSAIPNSLTRRARLLKGKLTLKSAESGGTQITLRLRTRRFGFRK
jgi:signal transduction histidine kinase